MTTAPLRMARYYLAYARRHKNDRQALDGAQFAQIRRGWAVASAGCAGLPADEQANLIFGYLNALDGYLERRGLWAEPLAWNRRALAAAQDIGNEAPVGGLLNDIGLCHRRLGRYEEAQAIFEQALAVRRRVGPVAGEAVTLNNLGLLCADLDDLVRAEVALAEVVALDERYDLPHLARDRRALTEIRGRRKRGRGGRQEAGRRRVGARQGAVGQAAAEGRDEAGRPGSRDRRSGRAAE